MRAQGLDPAAYLATYYGGQGAAPMGGAPTGYGAPMGAPMAMAQPSGGYVDPYAQPFMDPYAMGPSFYDQTQYDESEGQPTRTLWVGSIDPHTSEPQIRVAFEHFGPIESVKLLPHRNCAFVKYNDLNCAISAYNNMGGKVIGGRNIKIGWGKSDDDSTSMPPCKNLWLGNIVPTAREEEIEALFGSFGLIEKVRVLPHKNCAFVNFATLESAEKAKRVMQGTIFKGNSIKINYGKLDEETTIENYNYLNEQVIVKPNRPKDLKLCNVIEKCAEKVIEVGPAFEDVVKFRQSSNKMFSFLYEDDQNYDYYKWKIFDLRREEKLGAKKELVIPKWAQNAPEEVDVHPWQRSGPTTDSMPNYTTTVITESAVDSLPDYDKRSFVQMLKNISPDEEPIKKARIWIMDRPKYIDDICKIIAATVPSLRDFTTKMSVMYIINDILHFSKDNGNTVFPGSIYPYLEEFLMGTLEGHNTEESREKLIQLLEIWGKIKRFYPENDIEMLTRMVRNSVIGNKGGGYHNVPPPQQQQRRNNFDERNNNRGGEFYNDNRGGYQGRDNRSGRDNSRDARRDSGRDSSRGEYGRHKSRDGRHKRERDRSPDDLRDDRDKKRHRSRRHRD